jgi:hypothetical protein
MAHRRSGTERIIAELPTDCRQFRYSISRRGFICPGAFLFPRPAASVSRRKGGFFFAQNHPVFFLCRIFDPANFSCPGSPEAIF